MAFRSISLSPPSADTLSLPLAPAVSQSLYSSERGDRSNRQTFGISCEEMWWSPKIKLGIQLSTFGWRNVFSLTNAEYQAGASYKSVSFVNGNVYKLKIPH